MAGLGSWGLLCFAVLALPGPPGAGAQGKGVQEGTLSSSDSDLGDGPRMVGGVPSAVSLSRAPRFVPAGDRGGPGAPARVRVSGGTASVGFKKLAGAGARDPRVLSTAPCPGVLGGGEQQALLCLLPPAPQLPTGWGWRWNCCSEHEAETALYHGQEAEHPPGLKAPISPPPRGPRLHHKTWGASLWSSQGAALALVLVPLTTSRLLRAD